MGVSLADAEIEYAVSLPSHVFPADAGLGACDFTLDVDGGLVLFATALVGDRLLTARIARDGNVTVALNVSVAALGMGAAAAFPSSTMLPSGDLWYQLQGGLVCHNVVTGEYVNRVRLPSMSASWSSALSSLPPANAEADTETDAAAAADLASTSAVVVLSGLAYSQSTQHVHGVLTTTTTVRSSSSSSSLLSSSSSKTTSVLAEFDPQAEQPTLRVGSESFAAVARDGAAAALMSDKAQITVLAEESGGDGVDGGVSGSSSSTLTLLTLDLETGKQIASLALFCNNSAAAAAAASTTSVVARGACPSSLGYQPFLF